MPSSATVVHLGFIKRGGHFMSCYWDFRREDHRHPMSHLIFSCQRRGHGPMASLNMPLLSHHHHHHFSWSIMAASQQYYEDINFWWHLQDLSRLSSPLQMVVHPQCYNEVKVYFTSYASAMHEPKLLQLIVSFEVLGISWPSNVTHQQCRWPE